MPIHVLAPEIVSKIAAGEAIERPDSVVKELVENALDAGASQISIEAIGGGINLIRVTDNGTGISAPEIELAFQRHATSRIGHFSDLEDISSLGFRGEALASIAEVADVEMVTRTAHELAGTYLKLNKGQVAEKSSCARSQGTTLTVRYLFRNLPARLKFLKSSTTESSRIANLVSHYALAFPEVKFILSLDSRATLYTPGNNNLRDALAQVHGTAIARPMLTLSYQTTETGSGLPIHLEGLAGPPQLTRSNRSHQSLFVNRRWIQSRFLWRAIDEAYHGLIMAGKYPVVVINISLPANTIDVNVHPSKREVKFQYERILFSTIVKAIRKALAESPVPQARMTSPPAESLTVATPLLTTPPSTNSPASTATPVATPLPQLPILRVLGQLANSYIIAEGPEGLYLIDQHAAHERILFEKIQAQRAVQKVESQGLLQPLTVELTPEEDELLKIWTHILAEFGLNLEPFGGRTYLLRSVPSLLKNENLGELLRDILVSLAETGASNREERIALSLACHSAVKAGQILKDEEARELVRQLEQADQPRTCPHGRPTMIHLSSGELEKQFGRR